MPTKQEEFTPNFTKDLASIERPRGELYNSGTTTPKLLVPIDKVYFKTKRIDLRIIDSFRDRRWYQTKQRFRSDVNYSGNFQIAGRKITVHSNDLRSELQVNPTQWDSLKGLSTFVKLLSGEADPIISNLACYVHIPLSLADTRKAFTVSHKRATKVFRTETLTKESGTLKDIDFSGIYGSNKTISIAVYDAVKKHRDLNLSYPTTRIETRFQTHRFTPAKSLHDLWTLTGERLFNKIQLLKPLDTSELKRRDKIYWELLIQYRESVGLREAISRVGHLDPKHGHAIMKRLLKRMALHDISLPELFDTKMQAFANARPSKMEWQIIDLLKDKRRELKELDRAYQENLLSTSTSKLVVSQ